MKPFKQIAAGAIRILCWIETTAEWVAKVCKAIREAFKPKG